MGVCGLGDIRDDIFRARRSFDIDEKNNPTIGFEPPSEFADNAGFPQPSLACKKHMISLLNSACEEIELVLAIEEVLAADPAPG